MRKSRHVGNAPADQSIKEALDPGCLPLVPMSKMYRGYVIDVKGEVPEDIVERVSRLHGAALRDNTVIGMQLEPEKT